MMMMTDGSGSVFCSLKTYTKPFVFTVKFVGYNRTAALYIVSPFPTYLTVLELSLKRHIPLLISNKTFCGNIIVI